MKKRILSLFLLLTVLIGCVFSGSTYVMAAGSIRIEGEDYKSLNFNGNVPRGVTGLSGDACVRIQENFQQDKVYKVSYTVNVESGGMYSIKAATTILSGGYTSEYSIQVNDNEPMSVMSVAKQVGNVNSPAVAGIMAVYSVGSYPFVEGENTVSFIVDKPTSMNGSITFYLDYFEISESEWGVNSVRANAPVAVFEHGEPQSVHITFTGVPETRKLDFVVRDFWDSIIIDDSVTVKKSTTEMDLNLGKMNVGWYQIQLVDGEDVLAKTYFAVTPKYSDRIEGESPFAVDSASAWNEPAEQFEAYARALRLAGIQWTRERTSWAYYAQQPDSPFIYQGPYVGAQKAIANEGINISAVFHDTPEWTRPSGNRSLPEDLFVAYNAAKKLASDQPEIKTWEIWNEEDVTILFLDETADAYAAFMKAWAIGLTDSTANPLKSLGGFSWDRTPFVDLVYQNDVIDYIDINNYHHHASNDNNTISVDYDTGKPDIMLNAGNAYDKVGKPFWVGEAGMKVPVPEGEINPTQDTLRTQARYLVESAVQSISLGNDKNFWFLFPKYLENGGDFGTFYDDHTPHTAYQAMAVMTDVLGRGLYKGELLNMPERMRGHIVDNSINDVAVLWCDYSYAYKLKTDKPVKLMDFMGGEKMLYPTDGYVTITVNMGPQYAIFEGDSPASNYEARPYKERKLEPCSFTPEQRIVLNQTFDGIRYLEGKTYGYRKHKDTPFDMTVQVYNFNDEEMTGKIYPSAECKLEYDAPYKEVTIPPMSEVDVTFTIIGHDVEYDKMYDLCFQGEFNGKKTSRSVSHISFRHDENIPGYVLDYTDPAKWNEKNVTEGRNSWVKKGDNEGEIKLGADFIQPGDWYYPMLPVDGASMADSDGFGFWIKADKYVDFKDIDFIDAFVYLDDGSDYFVGTKPIAFIDDWVYYYITWDKWIQFLGGGRGLSTPDPRYITHVSIGFNTRRTTEITVKDLTFFKLDEQPSVDTSCVTFENVSEGDRFTYGDVPVFVADLPDNAVLEETRVLLNNYNYDGPTELKDGKMYVDLSGVEPGRYRVTVVAYNNLGRAYDTPVNIHIDPREG